MGVYKIGTLKEFKHATLDVCIIFRTWRSAAVSVRRSRTLPHWLLWRNVKHHRIRRELYDVTFAKLSEAEFLHLAFRKYVYSEPSLVLMFASPMMYMNKILCTSKSSCPAVVAGHNFEEDGHRHRGQLIVLHLKMKYNKQVKVVIT